MNKEQYLKRLSALISDISESERIEALKYYEEYFEDANMPDEDVIKQLGSPEEVAASIREELADKEIVVTYDSSERDNRYREFFEKNENRKNNREKRSETREKRSAGATAAMIALLIICSPIILPVIIALAAVIFAVTMVVLSMLIVSSACSLAFGAAAVISLIVAFVKIFVSPWVFGILLGACLLCLGLCFINILITIKLSTFVIPFYFKGLGSLLSLPFRKKEAVSA